MIRIKICCIASHQEARLAIEAGADHLGFVSAMPTGPGVIDEDTIRDVAAKVPSHIGTFLLTSRTEVEAIVSQHRRCGTNTIQLCDRLAGGTHEDLRRALPGVRLVQVVHVGGEESLEAACAAAPGVDALLLDSGNPNRAVKELGGTGRVHDWSMSARIRESVRIPVYLAGGLHSGNVGAAIERVRPHGVDLCTGVRTEGRLDSGKLEAFVRACRTAGAGFA